MDITTEEDFFRCETCGKLEKVLVNGYHFGDRLLEDVMFVVADDIGKPEVLGVHEDSIPYFEQLNKEYWLEECLQHCKKLDLATCPKCGNDVPVWDAFY